MTLAIEVIDGHTYLVTRDDAGNIVRQVAADVHPPFVDPDAVVKTVIRGGVIANPTERDAVLLFVAKRLL